MSSRRGALLYNPVAGRHRAKPLRDRLLEILRQAGWEVEASPTASPGHATELARELADENVEAVFTLGGDGTLREVAEGLLGSDTALAPLPGGTANVVCRTVGLPPRPLAAAHRLAAGGRRREVPVGLAGETPFLMQVSTGLDAAVVRQLDGRFKRRWGRLGVVLKALPVWWRYDFAPVSVEWGERHVTGSFVAICNLPLYGGGFRLAPDVELHEPCLQVVAFSGSGRTAALAFAAAVARGRHLRRGDVVAERVRAARLEAGTDLPFQVDGDPCSESPPIDVSVATDRLALLVPSPASARRDRRAMPRVERPGR